MSAERCELFVYYRVAAASACDAVRAVQLFQQRLCREHAGLSARVLRRPDEHDGEITLMETYACLEQGSRRLDSALEARIEDEARVLAQWLLGARHVERFEPLD